MGDISAVFDFETAMEVAFELFLQAGQITAVRPPFEPLDDENGNQVAISRPRVEIQFSCGGATGGDHVAQGAQRNATYTGTLELQVVTDSGPEGSAAHRDYRAMVRKLMSDARKGLQGVGNPALGINGANADGITYLPCHKVQDVREDGCTPNYKVERGFEISTLTYRINFGIDHGAWAELAD